MCLCTVYSPGDYPSGARVREYYYRRTTAVYCRGEYFQHFYKRIKYFFKCLGFQRTRVRWYAEN